MRSIQDPTPSGEIPLHLLCWRHLAEIGLCAEAGLENPSPQQVLKSPPDQATPKALLKSLMEVADLVEFFADLALKKRFFITPEL